MVRFNERTVFSLLLCTFSAVLLVQTLDLRPDAALVPQVIGVPFFILSAFQFLSDLFPGIGKRFAFTGTDKASLESAGDEDGFSLTGNYLFIVWMLLFVLLMYFTGVIASIVIAFFLYLKLLVKQSWKLSILYSLVFAASVYLIFVYGMGVYYFTSPGM